MFNSEKYQWLCDQTQQGTLLRVNTTDGGLIDIRTIEYKNGKIIANGTFDITDIWVYGFNENYKTMNYRYPTWPDQHYYYDTDNEYSWRVCKHVK